ncbi:DUF1983 domain-containing protein [Pseudomonas jessenii]|uniref:Uncharacterized protein DUF1983 n=1 Tax=Pseudomonas jessenii TaxID=77298 RepID=A0A370SWS0_PSEJE|nr:DUF1983 domain-containing protein [Pseudomonas jessenii]RDL24157.1 uncharacterized protein DUF1983 [Pseudomonas jessenii]
MQSHDYVPGVSGWKHDKVSGEFEFNSWTLGSAANAPERQMVSVEVASWSKYDLPKNAANLVQFMEAELQKVPEEYRHAAEFEEFDAGYGDGSFSSRLFLSYSRLETAEELADRLERAKNAGTQIKFEGGVTTIAQDGVIRVRIGNLAAPEPEHGPVEQPAKPFVVVDGTTYLNEAFIDDSMIARAKIASNWSVKMQVTQGGQYVAAGIGLGFPSQFLVRADRFVIQEGARSSDSGDALAMALKGWDAAGSALKACASLAVIDRIATVIGQTALCKELVEEIGKIHPRGKIGELEDKVDALRKDLDQLNLERIGEKGNADGASILLDRRLASIEHRLASLESNRFRRPHAN